MRTLRLSILALALACGLGHAAHAEGFLGVYEDLPLAPGLAEVQGTGLAFDSPAGRIVEGYAKGSVKAAEVLKFYAATLPQLGWTHESDTVYRREAEVLKLGTEADGHALVVHFTISPE
ncbi:MAG TPA: hypothetical protein VL974_15220 [Magnetospirillum sp.]|jgi:hypothetical protein|nr:hypothetical protein [Magnetospirillum sp.]